MFACRMFACRWIVAALAFAAVGCGPKCKDPKNPPTYAQIQTQFLTPYCTDCHAVNAADRHNSPANINYDTQANAVANADEGMNEVQSGAMPDPTLAKSLPSQAQRDLFIQWVVCGKK